MVDEQDLRARRVSHPWGGHRMSNLKAWRAFFNFTQPLVQPFVIAYLGFVALGNPNPWSIGVFIFFCALNIETRAMRIEERIKEGRPKGKTITITRDQLDDQPGLVAEHLRIITTLESYIADQERTASAQHRMANDLDKGIYDESFGKVDVEKMPPQAYRAAARANQRTANYLRRTLNPVKEEQ